MVKTFTISCEIELFEQFKQLINSRNEKVSTVLQLYMQSEVNQDRFDKDAIVRRIEALEEQVLKLLNDKGDIENED